MVLCCICGVEITGVSGGARCVQCLQQEVDITSGISRHLHVTECGTCRRWYRPGGQLVHAEPESRELLALCLKHVKGIKKEHQVVNASFIWTEPHSKELKVKVTIQEEVMAGVVMEQSVVVEFRVESLQCSDCKKTFTKHTWESSVQVRQRTDHRKTLLRLEQLILQHGAHKQLIKLEQTKDGMDFFFTRDRDAQDFVSFIKTWAVVRLNDSKHLVSHNSHNMTYRFKRTTCVEICPVCRDDLVFLPPKTAQALGGLPPLMLCSRALSVVGLVDPATCRTVEMSATEYWKRPFSAVCSMKQLKEFIVLDVNAEESRSCHGRDAAGPRGRLRTTVTPCEVEIARASDFGQNDERLLVRSHLGHILHPGDIALGYDLRTANLRVDEAELGAGPSVEVYLVRKQKAPKLAKKQPPGRKSRRGSAGPGADAASVADDGPSAGAPPTGEEGAEAAGDGEGQPPDDEDEEASELREAAAAMLDALGAPVPAREGAADGGAGAPAAEEGAEEEGAAAADESATAAAEAQEQAPAPESDGEQEQVEGGSGLADVVPSRWARGARREPRATKGRARKR